ncbi:MAG: neocarzinostatin apoprotein domain-containing protein [Microthrixaceae bacterium]
MSQEIDTSIGKVDRAANVGRCVIAAKLSGVAGTGAMKWSPIGFTEPTLEKLMISASPAGALRDGSSIKVTGSGGLPGESIMITQCVPGAGPNSIGTCDAIKGGQAVIADDGAYSIDYIAYRDILTTSTDDS